MADYLSRWRWESGETANPSPESADSGYVTASRSSGPSEPSGKGKQARGRKPWFGLSSELPGLPNRTDLLDESDRALAFARLLRDAADIRCPCPQLAARLPHLLETFAHRRLSMGNQEVIDSRRESTWFVMEYQQSVYAAEAFVGKPKRSISLTKHQNDL